MRFKKLILGVVGVGAMATMGAAGCSSTSGGTGNSATTSKTSSGSGGGTTTSEPCALKNTCTQAVDKTCVGLVSNAGQTKFGLRMSELDVTSPMALTTGIVKTTVSGAVGLALPSCNLNGTGTFSWLLQFDTTAGTLKTGGAKPVTDPTMGYSFDDEMITQGSQTFHVQPITYTGVTPDASGKFSITTGMDLIVPIFLNNAGTSSVLLPLHQAILTNGVISSNNDCIGSYNAAGLDPANSCNPDSTHPQFIDAAALSGYITLEEADGVIVSAINQSLCVLLSGNATLYGMTNAAGVTVCSRYAADAGANAGDIIYQGHWCSTTNMAASSTCADAEQLTGNFSASSVKILN